MQRCYPHTGNGCHSWCLSSSLSLPGPRHRRLATMRTLFTCSLNGDKEESKSRMVLRVKPTPTRFLINSLYTPMDNTPLHSISSVCNPWGYVCCATRREMRRLRQHTQQHDITSMAAFIKWRAYAWLRQLPYISDAVGLGPVQGVLKESQRC